MKLKIIYLLMTVAVIAGLAGCDAAPPQPSARDHWVAPGKFKKLKNILSSINLPNLAAGSALRSLNADSKSWIVLHNETTNMLTVYWISYDGHRQKYGGIAPRESYNGETYATHPWLLVDENDTPVALYVSAPGNCYAYVKK